MNKENLKESLISIVKSDFLLEISYSAIGCGIFTLIFFSFPDNCWDSPYLEAICAILTMGFLIIFLLFNQINPKNKIFKVNYKRNIILFSIFCFSLMCFLYFKTSFGTNGVQGDNYYRTAYITQMVHSGYPQDSAYKNLSTFFGPFYWYFLAIIAKIFMIKPYRMIKLGMLFLYYILPITMFEVWKKIYSEKISFIITAISILLIFNAYSPDRMIVIFFIVPFIMYYYENYTHKEFKTKDYIIAGILGSILVCSYYLYFLLIPIYFLISLFLNRKKLMNNIKQILIISTLIIVFSSWFWGPLLRDILILGFESHQNRYFALSGTQVEFRRYFRVSFLGLILFFGLVFLIRNYKISEDFRHLGNILISVNIIFLLGFIGVLIKYPIMHVRFIPIASYVLVISSSILFVKLMNFFANNDILKKRKININIFQIESYILIGLIFSSGYNMISDTYESEAYQIAYEDDVRYDLIDVVDELDYEDKIFLTNNIYVACYRPVYFFLLPNPYFSHPSALYNERVKFLEKLSDCDTSKEFYDEIVNCKFDTIDFFWLDTYNYTDFVFTVAVERFPEGRDYYDIVFKKVLFENEKYFKKIEIEGDIIYETLY